MRALLCAHLIKTLTLSSSFPFGIANASIALRSLNQDLPACPVRIADDVDALLWLAELASVEVIVVFSCSNFCLHFSNAIVEISSLDKEELLPLVGLLIGCYVILRNNQSTFPFVDIVKSQNSTGWRNNSPDN